MERVRVIAASEEEALKLGQKELAAKTGEKIEPAALTVKLVEEKKGLLGFGRKKIYQVALKDRGLSRREEGFLDMAVEDISIDGEFAVKINDDGVFLRVSPPEGKGKAVHYQQIKTTLDKKEIVEVDWQKVQSVLQDATDEWVKIAPRKPELDRDGKAEIEISKDKLKAFISYSPALGGKSLSTADLFNKLADAGVKYGIKGEKLEQIIKNRNPVEHLLIAEGSPPVPGKDAELIYHFEQKTESIGTEREDGSIDFYELGLITNVQPGDLLVTKKEAEPGKPGKAVTGEEIPPPRPRDIGLPSGKNVKKQDDHTLVAGIAGQVVLDGNRVHVLPVYEVDGDVDLSTGNIDFVGNVIIKGNVKEGFKVKAQGNVEIRGNVTGADIEARGKIIIHKGYIGKGNRRITAGGDVIVKFVENGIITTEKNIIVADAVMHSQLTAGESIEVTMKKGLLVGGVYKARNRIKANIIGSALATNTYLEVGIDPELKARIRNLKEGIKKDQLNLTKLKKAIIILDKLKKEGQLTQEKELLYGRLEKTVERLKKMIAEKRGEIEDIKEKMKIVENGYIAAGKKIFPGVKMTIGNSHLNIHDEMGPSKFIESEGEVRQVAL